MRPERRLQPGMDGGLRAALLVRPLQPLQHPLRTPELVPIRRGSWPPGDREDPGHLAIFKTKSKKGSRPRCGLLFIHSSGSRCAGNGNPISGSSLDWKMLHDRDSTDSRNSLLVGLRSKTSLDKHHSTSVPCSTIRQVSAGEVC